MKIVLFDIDGTLLLSGGAGRASMEVSLRDHFGTVGPVDYRYGGKTDKLIVRETMRLAGFDDAAIDARMDTVIERYLGGLRAELSNGKKHAYTLPGVRPIVDAVEAADDLVLGLLTGNVILGAELKLNAVGLAPARFRVGAFGSDHEDRPMLPPIARDRASAFLGQDVSGERLVIIGDTPADIDCGRGVGARAVAVATGGFSVEELASHGPVATLSDLSDTARVLELIRDA